jgi:MFS family permease
MLYPVMPMYLKSIGFTIAGIGILEGFVEAFAGFSKGYFGQLSDRTGRRVPFIRTGYALSALAKPLMAVWTFPAWIFGFRTMERLGKGIRTSARDAYLSDQTIPENKGRVFGFHRAMDSVGAAIGPAIALVVLYFLPEKYRLLFILSVLPGLAAVLLTFLIKEKRNISTLGLKSRTSFFSFAKYWKRAEPEYKYLVAGLLAFTLFNSSDAFLLLGLKNKGFSDSAVIGFYILFNVIYALTSYPMGRLSDRLGQRKVIFTGLFLFSASYCLFGLVSATGALVIVFILYGLYYSSMEGISKALITNIAKKEETATALGFFNGFSSVATLLASTISGLLWTIWSLKVMFLVSAAGAFIVLVYFGWIFRKSGILRITSPAR